MAREIGRKQKYNKNSLEKEWNENCVFPLVTHFHFYVSLSLSVSLQNKFVQSKLNLKLQLHNNLLRQRHYYFILFSFSRL